MHAFTLLLTLAAAVSASEIAIPGHQAVKRAVEARQTSGTGGGDAACLSSLMAVYSSMPTPPPEFISFAATASITDPCNLAVPASLSPVVSNYQSSVSSWLGQNSAKVSSALSQCPAYSSLAASAGAGVCTKPGSGSGTARTTGPAGSATGGSPPAATPAKAGARGNVVAAGMAAIGFIGAVAVL